MYAGPFPFMRKIQSAIRSGMTTGGTVRTMPVTSAAGGRSAWYGPVRGLSIGQRIAAGRYVRPMPATLPGTAVATPPVLRALATVRPGATWAERIAAARTGGTLGDVEGILDDIKGALATAVGFVKDTIKSGVTAIPGATDAINYVKAQVGKFFQLPQRIKAAQDRATALRAAATGKGFNTEAAEAGAVQGALTSLSGTYASTEKKLTGLLDGMKAAGFGALPVALLAVAVAVAASMAYLFKTISFNESVLDKIEKKVLTPKEAQELFGKSPLLGIDVPWWLWGAGIAIGGYVLYEKFGRGRGGSRAAT